MTITHRLKAENKLLHGSFSNAYEPILTIQSGDSVQLNTIGLEWGYQDKEGISTVYKSREKEDTPGHPLIGPIAIEGAKKGMTLEVKINEIIPAWYGWNVAGGPRGWQNNHLGLTEETQIKVQWELDSKSMTGHTKIGESTFSVPLAPFMGVMATAPLEEGVQSTIPPSYFGGNIDCKELVKGSSLFLPVAVDGAMFSVGDGHAAQGDGEVSGTAIECPMDQVELTLTLHEHIELSMPRANTPSGWITFGFDEDLNKATVIALDGMLQLMQEKYVLTKTEAMALASVSVDLHVTQIVNGVKGVHAILPHGVVEKN